MYHWDKTISSTKDIITAKVVEKKLERSEKYKKFSEAQPCDSSTGPSTAILDSSFSSQASVDSGDTFLPKRACTTSPSSIHIPKDIVKKMGPLADRVGVSDMQSTALTAGMINHSGGDVADISLSKSTTKRIRATAREVGVAMVKKDRSCQNGQINFDGKLLTDLGCFGKVNRLAVVVAQEEENQLLCVTKTDDSTGKTEAEAVKKALEDWGLKDLIIACGFDTTSSNTGIHKGSCVLLQEMLQRQLLWLACRHHILELLVKAAYHQVFGDTKAPDVKLFSILKDPSTWNNLDLQNCQLPTIPSSFKVDVDVLLSFIDEQLDEEN